ncbi:MAG: indolepyruvate ferredoxin oxidoreductase family protein [Alphaproteobacteria bacterium]|nr:indolepyruvate ferredoxin oxidoreductase family protein [Alphaproteobacteria bacterium]
MLLANVSLDDKYTAEAGRVFMTGMQALVRLPMMQRQRDLAAGLNTAGFISGYRGSPLGGYDTALWRAAPFLKRQHIHFQPGVNEDLAATSVWGTQQVNLWPGGRYDGVFGIWYGKGPGVDRSGDALKHGNINGTAPHGGVLTLAGDDHGCKSSTLAHQSEPSFMAASIPVLNPAGVQEYLDFGLHGFQMSRYSGCWVGFKCVGDTVESSATVSIDPNRVEIRLPQDFALPDGGLNIRNPDPFLGQEVRLLEWKLPAAQAYVRANGLDRVVVEADRPRLGIVTTGKAYLDVRQAFDELGLDEAALRDLGIRLYKVALVWPLEPEGALDFARGLEEIFVVEEKRGLIEDQLKALLYNRPETPRLIIGKRDEEGRVLLPESGEITPAMVARAIVGRLRRHHERPEFDQRLARLEQIEAAADGQPARLLRHAYFCSGCPHNTSTRLPEGSRAMAGIGCHGMALWVPERRTETITHMGGEGVNWIGQAPFTDTDHIFQNLGDGTYFHSGLMAIRAAAASGVNITYKILFNDAVAMTGGQPHDGQLTPWEISRQVAAEGAARVVVVTDEPDKDAAGPDWAPGVTVHHRDELDAVQRSLREIPGVTVLIYDQTCAAEKRRRRKRGTFPDPDRRVFINDAVCEDCGDCSVQSNCVSVEPLETPWGRKRQINQSACNKDFSCLKGFCPSFVTVEGGRIRRAEAAGGGVDLDLDAVPVPQVPPANEPFGILVTGIGGSGVITIGQLLGMAAHLEGKAASVLDMTGLAQKNGAVMSHVRIADDADALHAVAIATGGARTVLGCDIVVASAQDVLACVTEGVTQAVINSDLTPTPSFVLDPSVEVSTAPMVARLKVALGEAATDFVAATRLATLLLGDAIATNLFMVGYAYQRGLIPLGADALDRAIELNGVAVEANRRAFALGRLAAHDGDAVWAAARPLLRTEIEAEAPADLAGLVARNAAVLTDYQDRAYASRFQTLVERVSAAEAARAPGLSGLAVAVAANLFRLMAYKDEYEVARLYTSGDFEAKLAKQFEGDYRLKFHLAPPLLSPPDPVTGEAEKREFGPWTFAVLKWLAKMRRWRGSRLDLFGRTEERRLERQWIADYEALLEELIWTLSPENHALAVRLAEVPATIRGFGHVKARNIAQAEADLAALLPLYRDPTARADAAE